MKVSRESRKQIEEGPSRRRVIPVRGRLSSHLLLATKRFLTRISDHDHRRYPQTHMNDGQKGEQNEYYPLSSRQSVQPFQRVCMNVEKIIRNDAHRATRKTWANNEARAARKNSMGMFPLQLRNLSWWARDRRYWTYSCPVWSVQTAGERFSRHPPSLDKRGYARLSRELFSSG